MVGQQIAMKTEKFRPVLDTLPGRLLVRSGAKLNQGLGREAK
jgi:hypothetical protein